jgi:hypothetical protein
MTAALRKITRSPVISIVLAAAWLPYVATRCIESPPMHAGCGVRATAHRSGAEAQSAFHAGAAPVGRAHAHEHTNLPARTCCDLSGKCGVKAAPGTPLLASLQLVAAQAAPIHVTFAHEEPLLNQAGRTMGHAPPTYLRHVTLLL